MTDRLARLREMAREYEQQVDPPAWLSTLGQLDVARAIEIEEQRMREEERTSDSLPRRANHAD